ncbi:cell envelope integrity protein TolA [Cytobacillus oceanisediminis]|uniref:cell envelope integrity protein TolA n=1 Tax=Bacillaceae TaxID=186817 RepID=UPI001CCA4342|nr:MULTISPECIES: cell envelope integrity protein TolA [Bacillaceae]MBZ9535430.1 cell envelope integrity protein TolA [Cytobacillus oceanisediminis]UTI40077.1 cell envelope integrity protein TolA [Niallia sp. RD1]
MKWLKRNIINDFLEAVSNNEKKDKSATINISLFSKEISVKFHVDNLVGILNGAKNNKVLALPSPQEDNSSLEEIATPNSVVSENDPETLGSNSQSAEEKARQEAAAQEKARQEAAAQEKARQEAAAQEKARQEAAAQEKARQEAAAQEKARQEVAAQEKARQKAAAQEKARQEAAAQEKAKQEAAAQEKARQEAAAQEKARQKVAAQEKAKQEAAAQEKARQKAAAQEKARQKVAAQEKARQEAAAQEKARQKAVAQEKARQEVTAQEKAKKEALTMTKVETKLSPKEPIASTNQNFCVIAGKEYCMKIMAFYESLVKNSNNFNLWVCCTDAITYKFLNEKNLKNMHLIRVEEIEDDQLRAVKQERMINEYCWTLKSFVIEYILKNNDVEQVLYCDGDIYFFSNPDSIFNEWGSASIFLTPQRDLDWVEQKYGKYQAGIVGFRKDETGLAAVQWWKDRCIEWCSVVESNGRFGDQKYLDQLPIMYENVQISSNLGVNAAPWNIIYNNNFKISLQGDKVFINNDPLVAYHFSCLTIYSSDKYDLWNMHQLNIQKEIMNYIYVPYLDHLERVITSYQNSYPGIIKATLSTNDFIQAKTKYHSTKLKRKMIKYNNYLLLTSIFSKEYLVKGLAMYDSLSKQIENFHLWICTMDQETYDVLSNLNLKNVTLIPVETIETPQLKELKQQRTLQEYCWTIKATLLEHLLSTHSDIDHLFYCDSDLYFFSNPLSVTNDFGRYSVYLCRQRGTDLLEHFHGQYQAGFIGFKNEGNSRKILNWWKKKCLEECSDVYNDERKSWGDQLYLDRIPELFENIKVSENPGINAAPWNLILNNAEQEVTMRENNVYIDNNPLMFFHFGSLLILNVNEFDLWKLEEVNISSAILTNIYNPYLMKLREISNRLSNNAQFFANVPANYTAKNPYSIASL